MSIIPTFFGDRRGGSFFDPFSLDVWGPLRDFPFTSSSPTNFPGFSRETSALVNTRIDWRETPEAHEFRADLPGLKKEEVRVEVEEDRVLKISGERNREEEEEKTDRWRRVERSSGRFQTMFRLPENVKTDQIKATMADGVLTVRILKVQQKKPDVKAIKISG